ncbi:Four and a half LIM domains-containing protein [Echinococcus granulosus]|uniref:Four and a half LIM domains protein 3 n=1 Tax=Echinococcus granulosus TaxID=6210 RepID=U6JQ88_ECHGR|nr:Four and a half LIM domains-containing protein [Echinococcus granulosus]EUB57741.1 Four and a half LIM domains-containing protein [Echinococcus granulosus]CDS24027.1 Four and a half LIM domains protein 3 [Echinococcus granulosus]
MLNCSKCMQPIGEVGPVLALNRRWHPGCFVCEECNCNLVDKPFASKLNAPYCESCFANKHRPMCEKCSEPIESEQKYAVIGGKPHHATCFVCEVCQKALYGGKYASKNGRITCLAHR